MAVFRARNYSLASKWKAPGAVVNRRIGQDLVKRIVARTESGLDEQNRKFVPYAKDGPRAGETVDLRQSGDMLDHLGPIDVTATRFRLGWTSRTLRERAKRHHTGTRRGLPVRAFLGVPKSWVLAAVRRFYRPLK